MSFSPGTGVLSGVFSYCRRLVVSIGLWGVLSQHLTRLNSIHTGLGRLTAIEEGLDTLVGQSPGNCRYQLFLPLGLPGGLFAGRGLLRCQVVGSVEEFDHPLLKLLGLCWIDKVSTGLDQPQGRVREATTATKTLQGVPL